MVSVIASAPTCLNDSASDTDVSQFKITVAGRPGSGKSSVARELSRRMGLDHISAGDFMREMADERNVSVHVFGKLAEEDPAIDRAIDERSRVIGETKEAFVLDARLAWHFVPESYKVFLDVDSDVAAARIFRDERKSEVENVDLDRTRQNTSKRAESETKRYAQYYGVDYLDSTNYDLVIDTSYRTVEEVVDLIVSAVAVEET